MREPRIAYVIASWGGARRGQPAPRDWLHTHLKLLARRRASWISDVIVVAPEGENLHKGYLRTLRELESRGIRLLRRENNGLSYGSFSDAYGAFREELDVDYWIFVEDDWTFLKDDFDQELVEMLELLEAGYLCGLVDRIGRHNVLHAAISNGIAASEVLERVWEHNGGRFPYTDTRGRKAYYGQGGQVKFSYAFVSAGYSIADVTQFGYRAPFWQVRRVEIFDPERDEAFMAPVQMFENPGRRPVVRRNVVPLDDVRGLRYHSTENNDPPLERSEENMARWNRPRSEKDLEELYDFIYREEPGYGHLVGRHRRILTALYGRVDPPATVLDAGCGRGGLIRELERRGYVVAGTEVSNHLLETDLADLNVEKLRYEDYHAMPPAGFDVVVSSDVLEHLCDWEQIDNALQQLARVSKDYLLLTTAKHRSRNFSGKLETGDDWDGDLHLVQASREEWREHVERVMEIDEEDVDARGNTFFFFGRPRKETGS